MVDWNLYGLAFVPEAPALVALAFIIFRARPSAAQNQSLAMILFSLGGMAAGLVLGYLATDAHVARGGFAILYAAWFTLMVAQVRFAASLGVPWLRPLRRGSLDRGIIGLWLAGPLVAALWIRPRMFDTVAAYTPYVPWRPAYHPGAFETWSIVVALVSLVVLAAAGHAWRRAPTGSPLRAMMGTYFAAAALIETITIASTILRADIVHTISTGGFVADWKVPTFILSTVAFFLAYIVGLGYAILKAQVFDIDLRVKWTLRRGTLVGAFVLVFLIVAEVAQNMVSSSFGLAAGLAAAGILFLVKGTIERAADRLADRAMPRVTDDAEYRTVRKREVYRAAVESALQEGDISARERGMLGTFARELGLTPEEARDIEAGARTVRAEAAV